MDRPRVEAFNRRIAPDAGSAGPFVGWSREDTVRLFGREPHLFTDFMTTQARASYGDGLLRVLGPGTAPAAHEWNGAAGWPAAWPAYAGRLTVFAYDWMGRLYGLDRARVLSGEPLVTRLEPGDGRLRESDTTFAQFLLTDAAQYPDELLDRARFRAWIDAGGRPLGPSEAVGYVTPLFDGGIDEPSNMAIGDVGAYLTRLGRAYAERSGLGVRRRSGLRGRVAAALGR